MSRRSNNSTNRSGGGGGSRCNSNLNGGGSSNASLLPSSHSIENNPDHIAFLQRSLEHNDLDMAAVVDLNTSLRTLKQQIKAHCSELTLLDLGEGILRLAPITADNRVLDQKIVRIVQPQNTNQGTKLHSSNDDEDADAQNLDEQVEQRKESYSKKNDTAIPGDDDNVSNNENDEMQNANNALSPSVGGSHVYGDASNKSLYYEPYHFEYPYQEEMCVDFCLRMKLRRRLLSRIARRLLRIATAMDGMDVSPPAVPTKIRLNINETLLDDFTDHMKRQEQSFLKMQYRKMNENSDNNCHNDTIEQDSNGVGRDGPDSMLSSLAAVVSTSEVYSSTPTINDDTVPEEKVVTSVTSEGNGAEDEQCSGSEVPAVPVSSSIIPPGVKHEDDENATMHDSRNENDRIMTDQLGVNDQTNHRSPKLMTKHTDVDKDDDTMGEKEEAKADSDNGNENELSSVAIISANEIQKYYERRKQIHFEDDYEAWKDYNDMYEKEMDPRTGNTLCYTVCKQGHQSSASTAPTSIISDNLVGVNDVNGKSQNSNDNENDLEWKRYKDSLLSRIPIQPTYAELGLECNLFYGKERRQRAKEKLEEVQRQKSATEKEESIRIKREEENEEEKAVEMNFAKKQLKYEESKKNEFEDDDDSTVSEDDKMKDDSDPDDNDCKGKQTAKRGKQGSRPSPEPDDGGSIPGDDHADLDDQMIVDKDENDDTIDRVDAGNELDNDAKDQRMVKITGGKDLAFYANKKKNDNENGRKSDVVGSKDEKGSDDRGNTAEMETPAVDDHFSETLEEQASGGEADSKPYYDAPETVVAETDVNNLEYTSAVDHGSLVDIAPESATDPANSLSEVPAQEESLIGEESIATHPFGTGSESLSAIENGKHDDHNMMEGIEVEADASTTSDKITPTTIAADGSTLKSNEEKPSPDQTHAIVAVDNGTNTSEKVTSQADEGNLNSRSASPPFGLATKATMERLSTPSNEVSPIKEEVMISSRNDCKEISSDLKEQDCAPESHDANDSAHETPPESNDTEQADDEAHEIGRNEKDDTSNPRQEIKISQLAKQQLNDESESCKVEKTEGTKGRLEMADDPQGLGDTESDPDDLHCKKMAPEVEQSCDSKSDEEMQDETERTDDGDIGDDEVVNDSKMSDGSEEETERDEDDVKVDADLKSEIGADIATQRTELSGFTGKDDLSASKTLSNSSIKTDGACDPKLVSSAEKRHQKPEAIETTEKLNEEHAPPKRIRPISLVAIPSFYEQDLKRIKLVHTDLMTTSRHQYARRKLEDCTKSYNLALSASNETYDQRLKAQNMLNGLLNEQRTQQSLQQDYAVKLAVEKNRWNKRRMQFEHNRLNMFLPSRHGTYSTGTSYIQHYVSRPDHTGTTLQVGQCLADVVDAIDGLANRGMRLERFNEKFVPPPDPFRTDPATGESVPQRQQRLEKDLRHEIEQLNRSIRTSEESRSNAWKRMLRTKAEFGIPHDISVGSGPPKFVQVDMSNALTISLPVLRQTTTMNIDQSSNVASNPTMGSYTPAARRVANPRRPPVARPRSPVSTPAKEPSKSPTGTSVDTGAAESKYSLARVKERIAADGTVAPVSEPKLTKDGLYMRPAGRTRKGMNWDAIRGIWIPGPGYSVSNDDDD